MLWLSSHQMRPESSGKARNRWDCTLLPVTNRSRVLSLARPCAPDTFASTYCKVSADIKRPLWWARNVNIFATQARIHDYIVGLFICIRKGNKSEKEGLFIREKSDELRPLLSAAAATAS